MQKRIHKKSWNPKVNPHYLNNIFAHLDKKQFDMRKSRPIEWWERMLAKAREFNKKFVGWKEGNC